MRGKYPKAVLAIIFAFAIGLVGFYAFSAMYGDGLERTMEDNGASEGEPLWKAPLDYGDDYSSSLVMGIIGFVLVLTTVLAYLFVSRSRKSKKID